MAKILIIDDERAIRNTLRDILEFEHYEVDDASDGEEGLKKIAANSYDLVLCDVKMPKFDGLEVLEKAAEIKPDLQFIMISGHANIETAVEATRKGAFDFIEKPPDLNRLLIALRNALDKQHLVAETRVLKRKITGVREILGNSPAIIRIKETIERVASTDARVLITGENGTGKELIARWVHERSARAGRPIVEVNCAAIPSELIESELFGHEKGAFTSAIKMRIGKFEQAHGGTLFMDEVGDMSLAAQAKVLRALQEHKITRVGGDKDIQVDVRVIAATNKDLLAEIDAGRFREDLYHRLGVILIHSPALRERRDDVQILAQEFMKEVCAEYGYPIRSFAPDALTELAKLDWTGNVRELRNVIERLAIFCDKTVNASDVRELVPNAGSRRRPKASPDSLDAIIDRYDTLQDFKDFAEKQFVQRKLLKHNWNMTKTAEEMDIQRSHLYNKIEKYGIQREGGEQPQG